MGKFKRQHICVRVLLALLLSLSLTACATTATAPATESHLEEGQRLFEKGYYKRAMHELLPLACDGNPQAQYAVGYMYYYGQGVAQDTDVGYFWIKRSANQGYVPAKRALRIITSQEPPQVRGNAL